MMKGPLFELTFIRFEVALIKKSLFTANFKAF